MFPIRPGTVAAKIPVAPRKGRSEYSKLRPSISWQVADYKHHPILARGPIGNCHVEQVTLPARTTDYKECVS